jgi:hypothetical protein
MLHAQRILSYCRNLFQVKYSFQSSFLSHNFEQVSSFRWNIVCHSSLLKDRDYLRRLRFSNWLDYLLCRYLEVSRRSLRADGIVNVPALSMFQVYLIKLTRDRLIL